MSAQFNPYASGSDRRGLKDDEEWDPFFGAPVKRKKQPAVAVITAPEEKYESASSSSENRRSAEDTTMRGRSGAAAAASSMAFSVNDDTRSSSAQSMMSSQGGAGEAVVAKKTWTETALEWLPCIGQLGAGYNSAEVWKHKPASLSVIRNPDQMLRQVQQREPDLMKDQKNHGSVDEGGNLVPGTTDRRGEHDKRSLLAVDD